MADKIISVRMPASMVSELKDLANRNHYLDISEQLRSVLRNKMLDYRYPYSRSLSEISGKIEELKAPKKVEQLKSELKRILEELDEI